MKVIHKINCFSVGLLTIGYVFKLSYFKGGDEILRISTLLLALGLILQAIYSIQNKSINTEALRPFFILNSLFLAFSFLSIVIKIGHVGLPVIKHITFDIFTIPFLTVVLIYDFSTIEKVLAASREVKVLILKHIVLIFIFLILSLIYVTIYTETTNRIELMEMIK